MASPNKCIQSAKQIKKQQYTYMQFIWKFAKNKHNNKSLQVCVYVCVRLNERFADVNTAHEQKASSTGAACCKKRFSFYGKSSVLTVCVCMCHLLSHQIAKAKKKALWVAFITVIKTNMHNVCNLY